MPVPMIQQVDVNPELIKERDYYMSKISELESTRVYDVEKLKDQLTAQFN